jgi:hypothetical protein
MVAGDLVPKAIIASAPCQTRANAKSALRLNLSGILAIARGKPCRGAASLAGQRRPLSPP